MKEITLPIILIIQISALSTLLILTRAHPESEDTARYFYGYEVDFDDNGTVQGHAERRAGHQAKGNYFVTLSNGESHSDVQYIANRKGFQPIVRIATKDAHSQVSSHFAFGKDAVKALKAMESNTDKVEIKSPESNPNKLLTNEVIIQRPGRRGKVMIRKHKIINRPAGKSTKKPVKKATKLVSEDDVFNINGAAEEYFDEISEERINSSQIDFRENSSNGGFKNIPHQVKVQEIISNSRPKLKPKSRALKAKVQEIKISPLKLNVSEETYLSSTPRINIEIVENKQSKDLDVSTEVNVVSSISVSYSSTIGSNFVDNSTERANLVEAKPTRFEQNFGKATTISETFLAPLQAGLLLYGDESNRETFDEFEDNILSDSIQNTQAVPNHIEHVNKTVSIGIKEEKYEKEKPSEEVKTTFVESYYSSPVVEIVEKTVDGNPSIKYTDKTYYHSTERHVDGEKPTFLTTPKQPFMNDGEVLPTYIHSNMEILTPPPPIRPPIHPLKLKLPFTSFSNSNNVPLHPPPRVPFIPGHLLYRRPGNVFYTTHTQHRPVNSLGHENCFNCGYKVIKDDYFGPVPPMNEFSHWNTMNSRQQRQLTAEVTPRMEYGFKPLLRPSIEINDEGLPLVKSYS